MDQSQMAIDQQMLLTLLATARSHNRKARSL